MGRRSGPATRSSKVPRDPKELLEIKGVRATQEYLVNEVQKVYRDQGVSIHDKHIELIVRQMTKRILISEPGDTEFLPGYQVDRKLFTDTNRQVVEEGRQTCRGSSDADGDHQGVAGHGVVAVRGVVPGDHACADRSRHRVQVRLVASASRRTSSSAS